MKWEKCIKSEEISFIDETKFIIGLDIGNITSNISYFDFKKNKPELIDLSGGYGKPSIPTVCQYIIDSKEWIFGEYALYNYDMENNVVVNNIIERLGKLEYIDIGSRTISLIDIFSFFIKHILSSVKNINPKSSIIGIVCSVSNYLTDEVKEDILLAFAKAGYRDNLIGLYSNIECILANQYFNEYNNKVKERLMILDFGGNTIKGSVHDVDLNDKTLCSKNLSTFFYEELGNNSIDSYIKNLFYKYYLKNTNSTVDECNSEVLDKLNIFADEHKELIFNMNNKKFIRLYFNFVVPTFKVELDTEEINNFINPLKEQFSYYINKILEKDIYTGNFIPKDSINKVICHGGSFEMKWSKDIINELIPNAGIIMEKNTKSLLCKGACIIATGKLNYIDKQNIKILDRQEVAQDIGIFIGSETEKRFLPILKRKSFWWKYNKPQYVLINNKDDSIIIIDIYSRNEDGDFNLLCNASLDNIKKNFRDIIKLSIEIEFNTCEEIVITFIDNGFGEIFPSTGYSKALLLKV